MELPDIPDFLKVANRKPSTGTPLRPRRQRKPKSADWRLPRSIEPAGIALLAEIEAKKKAAAKARFAALRAQHGANK